VELLDYIGIVIWIPHHRKACICKVNSDLVLLIIVHGDFIQCFPKLCSTREGERRKGRKGRRGERREREVKERRGAER
jgi:hypothetical protein